ncbi:MAG: chemotaxis protein CheW [Deltaproteobacteria bacterium]|nr:chemotaxis protein CheW [Deltaproteobacteria bacterium]
MNDAQKKKGAEQPSPETTRRVQSLLFKCGADTYALPVTDVYKVVDLQIGNINPLPRAHAKVVGITQYRGRIITVLDTLRLLTSSDEESDFLVPSGPQTRLLVLDRAARSLGLLVQSVGQISSLVTAQEPSGRLVDPCTFRGDVVHLIDTERLVLLAVNAEEFDQGRRPS